MNIVKLQTLISKTQEYLSDCGIDNADLDTRLLIGHALSLDRAQLISQSNRHLNPEEIARIQSLIDRRTKYESVARIIGQREFWSLPFGLNEATLEPRPDSETLIEVALKTIKMRHSGEDRNPGNLSVSASGPYIWTPASAGVTPHGKSALKILDIGTGTGCLLLSLLHELPQATGLGLDIAPRAVEQAQHNAAQLGLGNRAEFKVNNWLDGIESKFDIIISNPPYIASDIIPTLSAEVRQFDPAQALDGGQDGLHAYKHLIPLLPKHLTANGFAVFEIGYDQADTIMTLFKQSGFSHISLHQDLGGNNRCILASIE